MMAFAIVRPFKGLSSAGDAPRAGRSRGFGRRGKARHCRPLHGM